MTLKTSPWYWCLQCKSYTATNNPSVPLRFQSGPQPRSQGLSSSLPSFLPLQGREEERPWERGWVVPVDDVKVDRDCRQETVREKLLSISADIFTTPTERLIGDWLGMCLPNVEVWLVTSKACRVSNKNGWQNYYIQKRQRPHPESIQMADSEQLKCLSK